MGERFTDIGIEKKLEMYKAYELRQLIVGKLFDFEVCDDGACILIRKYYDYPNRKEIEIPIFVDGLLEEVFAGCKHLKKVIMHSTVKGVLNYTFQDFVDKGWI